MPTEELQTPIAVVDTCVLVDIFTCADLADGYEKLAQASGLGCVLEPEAIYRRARARESILLGLHFHKLSAATYSLCDEVVRLTTQKGLLPDDTFQRHYSTLFVHFIWPRLLGGWRVGSDPQASLGLAGDVADSHLLEAARDRGVPLITNEGYGVGGVRNKKLRQRARKAGVRVFTPREYWEGKIDPKRESEEFLAHLGELTPSDIVPQFAPSVAEDSLPRLRGYFWHVLLGMTVGYDQPLRTSV